MAYKKYKKKESDEVEKMDPKQDLVNNLLESMKEALKWNKDWITCKVRPYNAITGHRYNGINIVSLGSRGFPDPRFYPASEVAKLYKDSDGAIRINKGEKACRVMFASPFERDTGKTDEQGNAVTESRIAWKYHAVYNAAQLQGIAPLPESELQTSFTDNKEAELLIRAMQEKAKLTIEHTAAGTPHYRPDTHSIGMPHKEQFKSEEAYYATMLHEIGHSTGHPSLLARDHSGRRNGSKAQLQSYAYEELVAELASVYGSHEVGLSYDRGAHENHAAYLQSWISALENDKNYIFKASADANKAINLMTTLTKELKAELGLDAKQEQGLEEKEPVQKLKLKIEPVMSM